MSLVSHLSTLQSKWSILFQPLILSRVTADVLSEALYVVRSKVCYRPLLNLPLTRTLTTGPFLGLMLTWVCYTYFRRTFNLSIGSSWGEDSNGLPLVQGESTNHYFQSSLLIHVTIKKNQTKIYPIHLMQLKLLSTSDSMKSRNSILQRDSSSDLTESQSVF